MTTVLIADDQPLIRHAVRTILEADGLHVVGEAETGEQAVTLSKDLKPDVVLMDIRMPGGGGIAATSAICEDPSLADTSILILTTFEEDDNIVSALRAGAAGFLGKGAEPDEICRAVRAVHDGQTLLSPAATLTLVERYVLGGKPARESSELTRLTDREREILLLVARGLSNSEIAASLVISPHTVKTHVNRVMAKTHSHDRAQLVILAYETGLLIPGRRPGRRLVRCSTLSWRTSRPINRPIPRSSTCAITTSQPSTVR